ncbi:2-dehydro-3-deoxygalactonokinase [Primorskyibacter sedentarius]|uniref:2-dehydro-3-deoxygalactonokinase n=1 Tax=Primorskyibacter sedentarius TaxID=745311 RepID=A0A4R3J3N8_9RHOB|nr:2-dehydro-3-deoxygalactonokinase [Primorskyibacter sedentarius]TCS58979.1 2-dehydro-3-deoxygalactonokinase [Primorskyibacter sedentarius]
MNSVASDPVLIGLDWGTSSLRAFLIGADGEVLDRQSSGEGILQVPDRDFEGAFARLLAPWNAHSNLPVIASGMITSRNGWVETPYVSTPSGADALANALAEHQAENGRTVHFVTGMTDESGGAPDVMRGEETQIVGALDGIGGDGTFVMPGTHSKWIDVRGGSIARFATYMTGDVFAALRDHTILGALIQDGDFNEAGFREGVVAGRDGGHNLLRTLFHVRTLPLFGRIDANMVTDFLSGMLIGAELEATKSVSSDGGPITIVGRDDLADRYQIACEIFDLNCKRAPHDIAARGHFAIATYAGLL